MIFPTTIALQSVKETLIDSLAVIRIITVDDSGAWLAGRLQLFGLACVAEPVKLRASGTSANAL